jgi:hypothetical protein
MLLGISMIFTLGGLTMVLSDPSNRNVGIVTITFFGLCTATSAATIIRKLRLRRPRPLQVEIVGGVPMRPSRIKGLTYSAAITALGAVIIVFGRAYPELFWLIGWLLTIAGCFLLFALAVGRLPIGHLQVDPAGITVSRGSWAYTIPWDGISAISEREFWDQLFLLIWVHDQDVVSVHPVERKDKLIRLFAQNLQWYGAPVVVLPSRYGMDPSLLFQALERYCTVPSARTELSRGFLCEKANP